MALIPPKIRVSASALLNNTLPRDRDACVKDSGTVLRDLSMEVVPKKDFSLIGDDWFLSMTRVKRDRFLVRLALYGTDGSVLSHTVAYNGGTVIDQEYSDRVNDTVDRSSRRCAYLCFAKLFMVMSLDEMSIDSVHRLCFVPSVVDAGVPLLPFPLQSKARQLLCLELPRDRHATMNDVHTPLQRLVLQDVHLKWVVLVDLTFNTQEPNSFIKFVGIDGVKMHCNN